MCWPNCWAQSTQAQLLEACRSCGNTNSYNSYWNLGRSAVTEEKEA